MRYYASLAGIQSRVGEWIASAGAKQALELRADKLTVLGASLVRPHVSRLYMVRILTVDEAGLSAAKEKSYDGVPERHRAPQATHEYSRCCNAHAR